MESLGVDRAGLEWLMTMVVSRGWAILGAAMVVGAVWIHLRVHFKAEADSGRGWCQSCSARGYSGL